MALVPLTTPADADAVMDAGPAFLFKHSRRCPVSSDAAYEVARFVERRPEVPVYLIDVITHRDVARHVEARTGIRHHSPQVLWMDGGECRWNASHGRITVEALEERLAGAGSGEER